MAQEPADAKPFHARWMPAWILGGLALVAASTLLLASRTTPHRLEVDLSEKTRVEPSSATQARVLRVAVATMFTPTTNLGAYRKIVDYLGARLQVPSEIIQRSSYTEVNTLFAAGEADLAFICSGAYIILREQGDAELLAVPVVDGLTTYQSWVIVRADLDATTFEELRGRSFAFVDPISNTGYYFPVWWALQLGEDPTTFFGPTTFTHSHEKSIEMVDEGVVDAAAVDQLVFEALIKQRPHLAHRLRIVEKSNSFGIPPVVVRRDMGLELRENLRALFLGIHRTSTGRQALESLGFERFVPGRDADYDSIETMLVDIRREIQ